TAMYQLQSVRVMGCATSLCLVSWMLASCVDRPPGDEAEGQIESEIVNGTNMIGTYPEFVVLNSSVLGCSAVLLAPRIALTAGHCHGTGMTIFRDGIPPVPVNRYVWWGDGSSGEADFMLVELTRPVNLKRYPVIGTDLAVGNTITQMGRIHGGEVTSTGW